MVGCRQAGFALGLIVEPSGGLRAGEQDQTVILGLLLRAGELLNIFRREANESHRLQRFYRR
jgi:hypothetical protein